MLEEKANEIKAAAEAKRLGRNRKVAFSNGKQSQGSLREFLEGNDPCEENEQEILDTDPIADLFPEATVLFADLVGFSTFRRFPLRSQ